MAEPLMQASTETATASDPALLEIENLRTYFHTKRGVVRAVDGVSMEVRRGETVGIVGESGSGKSVFVRTIMNLLGPNASVQPGSSIRFEGRDVLELSKRQARRLWGMEIAMVFQDPMTALNPVRKIDAQLTEAMRIRLGLSKQAALVRAENLLDQVGIPDARRRLRQYPHELSGGMRQRVTIAIALACEPALLIADEPTTALDVTVQAQILDLLAAIQQDREMTMILITHDLGVVANQADRIAVMYAGRIVEWTSATRLFERANHPYTEALLRSVPRIENPNHTRLAVIPGHPPSLTSGQTACAFAPRCGYAQQRCVQERPTLSAHGDGDEMYACHFPVGSAEGEEAAAINRSRGHTATGLPFAATETG